MKERKNFVEALETQNKKRKTLTENFAVAYETSGKELLDFNFKLSQFRTMEENAIKHRFSAVFFEDPLIATKFVFYVGDVRGGLGERKVFRACFDWLVENKPEVAEALLPVIPEYTRWDNLTRLASNKKIKAAVMKVISAQLSEDIVNMSQKKPISLLAKWMPSENASSPATKALATEIRTGLEMKPRAYRKTLSSLRKYLDITEVKVSANNWNKIKYEAVPSQANLKYKNAFMKHDADRRKEYLESLKKGEAKINAGTLQPHEIVHKYNGNSWWSELNDYDETLEQLWKNLPSIMTEDTLVVRDGSGSMTCTFGNSMLTCLDVATALAVYCAEHNSEEWRDKFITFSSRPKFINMSKCKSLRDKLKLCYEQSECSNTDIQATMELILNTAKRNGFTQDEMPSNILIISDMQFDAHRGYGFNWNKSLFEKIAAEYELAGYKLPKIIFWNVAARNSDTIPMQDNELGLILCSGFSVNNMKMFMTGEIDPYKILLEQINVERYTKIEELVKEIL